MAYKNEFAGKDVFMIQCTNLNEALMLASFNRKTETIGVLAEKTLHSVLKYYFCSDSLLHEIKFKGYVADILEERNGNVPLIVEIQTKQAFRLAKKLASYADDAEIIIVLPVICEKTIALRSAVTGEIVSTRKSPKHPNIYHALKEAYGIREYINNRNITLCIPFIKAVEYKNTENISEKDIVPEEITDIVYLKSAQDYMKLIPFKSDVDFTVDEFAKLAKISVKDARYALLALHTAGVTEQCGKNGRKKLWRLKPMF